MAINLVDLVRNQLSSGFVDAASKVTGQDTSQAHSALGGAIPAILAGLLGSASTSSGSNALASVLRTQDPNLLDNLPGMLGTASQSSFITTGFNMLSSLLGESRLGGLVRALGSFGGMSQGGAQGLLGLLAPVVMGVLGQQQRARGLSSDGVVQMLRDQKDNIRGALPSGLATALGSAGILDGLSDRVSGAAGAATRTASGLAGSAADTVRTATPPRSAWPKYVAAVVVLAAIIWAISSFMGHRQEQPAPQATAPTTTAPTTTGNTTASTASLGNMTVGDVDVGKTFTSVSDGLTQTMKDIKDSDSAKAALPKLTDLTNKLDSLTPLVGKLPDASKAAFTDLVKKAAAALKTQVDQLNALPGVSDVIKPVVESLNTKLAALGA